MVVGRWARVAALGVVLGGVVGCSSVTAVVDTIDVAGAASILQSNPHVVLLDIRTPTEYADTHLEGAINIDFTAADFPRRLADLDRNATYVIYCRSGNRSTAALGTFRDLGFTSVHAIDGGIVAWQGSGRPVVAG